jgi:hypothetical protein
VVGRRYTGFLLTLQSPLMQTHAVMWSRFHSVTVSVTPIARKRLWLGVVPVV